MGYLTYSPKSNLESKDGLTLAPDVDVYIFVYLYQAQIQWTFPHNCTVDFPKSIMVQLFQVSLKKMDIVL